MINDTEILENIQAGHIVIRPFDKTFLGTNSYDLHLGNTLTIYLDKELDVKKTSETYNFSIPPEGYLLQPGQLYLGATLEYTETHYHVPFLEGKSSTARLGLLCHQTCGVGDTGFCNHWTLEISCLHPIRIYAGMPIAQIFYFKINHQTITNFYNKKKGAKYCQVTPLPQPSQMYKNFPSKGGLKE